MVLALALSLAGCSQNGADKNTDKQTASMAPVGDGYVLNIVKYSNTDITTTMKAEAAKAKAKGLKPFVFFHASWCGPCKQLIKDLDNPVMKAAFKGQYIVELDTDDWGQEIQHIKYPVSSIPAFCRIEDDGTLNVKSLTDASQWNVNAIEKSAPILKAYFAGN